jgi:predicted  nucleic acid-binding Zn-ribbon protein
VVKLEAEMEEIGKAIKAVEAELVALGKKLAPLEDKSLGERSVDEKAEIVQLRRKEEQLREKEMKLMDERAEKRSKIAPGIVCFASVNTP